MNKTLRTSVTAIALAGGGIIGVGSLAAASYGDEPPTLDDATVEDDSDPVGLQDATDDTEDTTDDATDETSEDGTVEATDEATTDEESDHHGRRGGCGDSEAVAEALGMTSDELQAARDAGQSLSEIAADQNVSVDAVVDALVGDVEAHLAEEVAEGDLTQEEADERLASAEERATERVEATPGEDGARGFRGGRGDRNGAPADADADTGPSTDDASADSDA